MRLAILFLQKDDFIKVLLDIFGTFGAVVAPVTSMGLGMPLLTLLIQTIFNVPADKVMILQISILVIWILIFGMSVYKGLNKGIKKLSDVNVALAFLFMIVWYTFYIKIRN